MSEAADEPTTSTDADMPEPGTDSTVTDWHGQEVDRDIEAAEAALTAADGDEEAAEEIFDRNRPDHPSEPFKVPAQEREATLVSPDDDANE